MRHFRTLEILLTSLALSDDGKTVVHPFLPQPMRRSLCARILAAGRDDIVRFSPGTQRDMQSRLWESGLSLSNTERVELCTVWWACRQRNRWRQPLWWTHSTHFIDLGFPPEMLIGFEPRPKKLIGFQIAHRFSMPIRVPVPRCR